MNKVVKLSTFCCILCLMFLELFNSIVNEVSLNGYDILILLCMILNPVTNVCRINKKIINNFIYHLLIILTTIYISFLSINSLLIYKKYYKMYDSDFINNAVNYFGNRFVFVIIIVFIIMISSLFLKKEKISFEKDNSNILIFVALLTTIIPFFGGVSNSIGNVINLSNFIFIIIIFLRKRNINITSEMQNYYFILFVLSIGSFNPISMVLSIYLYLQLDKFGINV